MYWLIFFNGHDIPSVEASFIIPWCLRKYIDSISGTIIFEHYSVFDPFTFKAMPLKEFLEIHMED